MKDLIIQGRIIDLVKIDGVEGYLPVMEIDGKKHIVGLGEHWTALENYFIKNHNYDSYFILYPEGR